MALPILGYRVFNATEVGFMAISNGYLWDAGLNKSECNLYRHFDRPGSLHNMRECICGLHAFHTIEQVLVTYSSSPQMELVLVAVAGVGKILVYHEGWRSEFSRVIGVLKSKYISSYHARSASQFFGVPLLPQRQLERYALEHAEPHYVGGYPSIAVSSIMQDYSSLLPVVVPRNPSSRAMPWLDKLLLSSENDIVLGFEHPSPKTVDLLKEMSRYGYRMFGSKTTVGIGEVRNWCLYAQREIDLRTDKSPLLREHFKSRRFEFSP